MDKKWVSIFANSLACNEYTPTNYAKNITLRYYIKPLVGGDKIRIRFSNINGNESITLDKITVSYSDDNISVYGFKEVTFGGNTSVSILKGESIISDEIIFSVKRAQNIAVNIYLRNYTDMTTAVATSGPQSDNYAFAIGDHTFSEKIPPELYEKCSRVYFLDTIDVLSDTDVKSVVLFGDSITAQSWPEWFAERLFDSDIENISVIRRAISGSRVLREYNCMSLKKYGKTGIDRFENDIVNCSGIDSVFVLHGINDIIHPDGIKPFRPMSELPSAQDLIDGYKKYISIAHKHNIKIFFGTLLPIKGWRSYEDFRNELRVAVNDWIRNNNDADGYVDFDVNMLDCSDVRSLNPLYDSGDHLHPSIEGAKNMATLFPIEILE